MGSGMKKELDYFRIGDSLGGDQDWFTDRWMHLGGCAAVTACDCCILLERKGLAGGLYPYELRALSRQAYVDFGMLMKPFLRPRWGGVDRPEIYADGMREYLRSVGNTELRVEALGDGEDDRAAMDTIRRQIDCGFPVPFLLLRHPDKRFEEYLWHWFVLAGYEDGEEPLVRAVTYGADEYLPFRALWNSGLKNNCGIILFSTGTVSPQSLDR